MEFSGPDLKDEKDGAVQVWVWRTSANFLIIFQLLAGYLVRAGTTFTELGRVSLPKQPAVTLQTYTCEHLVKIINPCNTLKCHW